MARRLFRRLQAVSGGGRRWLGAAKSSRLLPHLGLFGIVQDAAKAFKWFKRAADNNQACNYYVGWGYAMGNGVKKNQIRALMYYEKGAALAESVCCFELGGLFESGLMGLDHVDKAEARRYYTHTHTL